MTSNVNKEQEQESLDNKKLNANFKYLENTFGVATMLATIPQIYKITINIFQYGLWEV